MFKIRKLNPKKVCKLLENPNYGVLEEIMKYLNYHDIFQIHIELTCKRFKLAITRSLKGRNFYTNFNKEYKYFRFTMRWINSSTPPLFSWQIGKDEYSIDMGEVFEYKSKKCLDSNTRNQSVLMTKTLFNRTWNKYTRSPEDTSYEVITKYDLEWEKIMYKGLLSKEISHLLICQLIEKAKWDNRNLTVFIDLYKNLVQWKKKSFKYIQRYKKIFNTILKKNYKMTKEEFLNYNLGFVKSFGCLIKLLNS